MPVNDLDVLNIAGYKFEQLNDIEVLQRPLGGYTCFD